MPRGPGQEEQQSRDRAPDDAGRVLRPGEPEQKGTTPRKVQPQEELGSSWGKVAEGSLELGLQGQVTRHTVGPVGNHMHGEGQPVPGRCQSPAAGPVETERVRNTGAGAVGRVQVLGQGLS